MECLLRYVSNIIHRLRAFCTRFDCKSWKDSRSYRELLKIHFNNYIFSTVVSVIRWDQVTTCNAYRNSVLLWKRMVGLCHQVVVFWYSRRSEITSTFLTAIDCIGFFLFSKTVTKVLKSWRNDYRNING